MRFVSILEMARRLVGAAVAEGDVVLDATLGNGRDALWLATLVGESGWVVGFDVQEAAIAASRARLEAAGMLGRVELVRAGHETFGNWFDENRPGVRLAAAMFNLGYLPGGDAEERVVTRPETTLKALEQAFERLKSGGLLTVVVYPGHPGGAEEAEAVLSWARGLPPSKGTALWYQFLNRVNPPSLVAVSKV